jgi:hypothetical protein
MSADLSPVEAEQFVTIINADPDEVSDHFGLCPKCVEQGELPKEGYPYTNCGRSHWFYCKRHARDGASGPTYSLRGATRQLMSRNRPGTTSASTTSRKSKRHGFPKNSPTVTFFVGSSLGG